jgi:hypothetical protein
VSLEERTEDEWRRLLASMRVAGAPDPHPERAPAVRSVIREAWDERENMGRVDRAKARRVMRAASPADRAYVAHLLGAR